MVTRRGPRKTCPLPRALTASKAIRHVALSSFQSKIPPQCGLSSSTVCVPERACKQPPEELAAIYFSLGFGPSRQRPGQGSMSMFRNSDKQLPRKQRFFSSAKVKLALGACALPVALGTLGATLGLGRARDPPGDRASPRKEARGAGLCSGPAKRAGTRFLLLAEWSSMREPGPSQSRSAPMWVDRAQGAQRP